MCTDDEILDLKYSRLANMISGLQVDVVAKASSEYNLTADDTIKQFSYIMAEKVKKDALDRKAQKQVSSKPSSFIDFICAVLLTNTNSIHHARL
jgi:hypothetical protein